MIDFVGNEANGIHSLYNSIIGFLSVAELGVGSAITFCMYAPIVENDRQKVNALFNLFKKLYVIIGAVILIGGFVIMPFLPMLAKGYEETNVNLYLTFFLLLISILITYAFAAKTSLINAYKNNYITTTISSVGRLIEYGLQIVVLILTKSFVYYLICCIVSSLLQWLATEYVFRHDYKNLLGASSKLDEETKKGVVKSIKAMFMHKFGSVLVNALDSMIISAFIGIAILGKYSNYVLVCTAGVVILSLVFTPLTAVIGHFCVEEHENTEEIQRYYHFFYGVNYVLGAIFFLGYYAVIDNVIAICFGGDLLLGKSVSFVITLNYFIQFIRQSTLLFRDATGSFYNDRWKPLFEGLSNLVLSIVLVSVLGVVGVILATILTNLFICHIVEPFVLHKNVFKISVKSFCIKNYAYILLFTLGLIAVHFSTVSIGNIWLEILVNGVIGVLYATLLIAVVLLTNKDFKMRVKQFLRRK
ncbi:MAG: hypothetical protein IJ506_03010 [Clostridia bacterium]|nr:hypothetical protein [Clostridia bacterium]